MARTHAVQLALDEEARAKLERGDRPGPVREPSWHTARRLTKAGRPPVI
ncbi:hypothetical protein [Streptomyces sp. NPDC001020]